MTTTITATTTVSNRPTDSSQCRRNRRRRW